MDSRLRGNDVSRVIRGRLKEVQYLNHLTVTKNLRGTIPADLEIPELTAKEIAELEAMRDEMERDREEQAQRLAKSPYKD